MMSWGVTILSNIIGYCISCLSYTYHFTYVWYGMVWYGMVWHGMAWHGMAWYGMYVCNVYPLIHVMIIL